MKMFQAIAISLFIIIIASPLYAINKIYLGNVDGTPPIEPAPPSSGSLLTTAGVQNSSPGSFWGFSTTTPPTVKYSDDLGITWNNSPVNPGNNYTGLKVIGSRILVQAYPTSSTCVVYYSDNAGSSWTTVNFAGTNYYCGSTNERDSLQCFGTTCYAVASTGSAGNGNVKVWRTTDSGSSWSLLYTTSGLNVTAPAVKYYDGTNIIIVTGTYTPCSSTSNGTIITSTDNGASWNIWAEPSCSTREYYFRDAVKLGNTYYVVDSSNGANMPLQIATSTDLVNWTMTTPTGLPVQSSSYISFEAYTNYNPDTMFLIMRNSADQRIKVYSSDNGFSFTEIYDTGNVSQTGNLIQSGNKLFFGSANNRYYKLE